MSCILEVAAGNGEVTLASVDPHDQSNLYYGFLEGLRVADTSVIPDLVRAHTNTTATAIEERIADWVKSQGS